MADKVEVTWFNERGQFIKTLSHSSLKAHTVYNQSLDKFEKPECAENVIVCLRKENNDLMKSWTNMTPERSYPAFGIKKKTTKWRGILYSRY